MLRRTASAGDFEHLHSLPDAAASSAVMAEWGADIMGRPNRQLRLEKSKPLDVCEVSAASTEVPLYCTLRPGQHQMPLT